MSPFLLIALLFAAQKDIVFADFEGETYGPGWTIEGTAFGTGPAPGTLPGQMAVSGFRGRRLVNSYLGGDDARGRLISPEFKIDRRYIAFRIGGGGWPGKTSVDLVVDGTVVRAATGPNTQPGGSERLVRNGWDVGDLRGKRAHIAIVDDAVGGWGHINVDDITFTDTEPPIGSTTIRTDVSREITVAKRWLNVPVVSGAPKRGVVVRDANGNIVRRFDAELADDSDDADGGWLAPLDLGAWRGQKITFTVDRLPENSRALERITQTDAKPDLPRQYREALRPQFHFSARRGWLNDPNGMAFFHGEYHLFFQHSPFSWGDGAKHWGQAVSRDLVHWTEVDEEALSPDDLGAMWSGSGVVDWKNTSGFGADGKPPLVLIYTAAGDPFTQCIAYSTDGRHFTKYAGNPVLPNVSNGNRDPKVFWHEPTGRWVMTLYVEKAGKHTIHFYSSPNLKTWTLESVSEGVPGTSFLYECPDFFELPVDGTNEKKWVLTAANTEYAVGTFDGKTFVPETRPLPGHRGRGYYAPQTFSDSPDGRRVQIGWFQTETPGMPFNQSMSVPMELRLIATPDGPRLTWNPVSELETLRKTTHALGPVTLTEAAPNPLAKIAGELLEIRAAFEPGDAREIAFTVRGVSVVFDTATREIVVGGHRAPAPLLADGAQSLTVFVDRTGLEVFTSGGRTFVPLPVNLKADDRSLSLAVKGGGAVRFRELSVHELRSAWR